MTKIDFNKASFKDFENIPGYSIQEKSQAFSDYLDFLKDNGKLNYRLTSYKGCNPELIIKSPKTSNPIEVISFVSNDYLGLTQHPEVKSAVISGIEIFGTGSAASPAIGGHFSYHETLEKELANFFQKDDTIIYNTGYTANSSTFQCLLNKDDIAILDMAVHASIYEGCILTNVKTFLHNNLEMLEMVLKNVSGKYKNKMIIIDGVYSQDGDIAKLPEIIYLAKKYNALLAVDDAHGIGVVGQTGRGVIEKFNVFDQVDLIVGTMSKSIGNLGGFVCGDKDLIRYLKFQSRQHLFSTTSTPAIIGVLKSLEIIKNNNDLREKLWENINYFKNKLILNGFEIGQPESAIIPVKIGDIQKTLELGNFLLKNGIHANPIMYPAVSKKDARIRFNLMATHELYHFDKVIDVLNEAKITLNI